MFQSSSKRLRAWLSRFDDVLGDAPADAPSRDELFLSHPHRRPLRWERDRRPGAIPPRPAYCVSPVRSVVDEVERERAAH